MYTYLRAQIAKDVAALARMDSSPASRIPSRATHRFTDVAQYARSRSIGAGVFRNIGPALIRKKQEAAAEEWENQQLARMLYACHDNTEDTR